MERHAVVEFIARELLDALGMFGRDVGAQLDDDAALRGVDHQGVLRVGTGRQWLRKSGDAAIRIPPTQPEPDGYAEAAGIAATGARDQRGRSG